jgi:hypothetical protein
MACFVRLNRQLALISHSTVRTDGSRTVPFRFRRSQVSSEKYRVLLTGTISTRYTSNCFDTVIRIRSMGSSRPPLRSLTLILSTQRRASDWTCEGN